MNSIRLALLCGTLSVAAAAQADDRLLLFGGDVADTSYYSYVGTVLPLRELSDGRRLVQRYWLDRFGYKYDGAPGRIDADAWGAEAAVGYVTASSAGWLETSVGLRYTDTDLDPDDPGAEARGEQLGAKLQLQGERNLNDRWRFGGIASYATKQNGYWGRMRLLRQMTAAASLGAELVAGGNDESDMTSAGMVLSLRPGAGPWTVGLRSGYRWDEESDSVYVGVEMGYGF